MAYSVARQTAERMAAHGTAHCRRGVCTNIKRHSLRVGRPWLLWLLCGAAPGGRMLCDRAVKGDCRHCVRCCGVRAAAVDGCTARCGDGHDPQSRASWGSKGARCSEAWKPGAGAGEKRADVVVAMVGMVAETEAGESCAGPSAMAMHAARLAPRDDPKDAAAGREQGSISCVYSASSCACVLLELPHHYHHHQPQLLPMQMGPRLSIARASSPRCCTLHCTLRRPAPPPPPPLQSLPVT